MPDAAVILILGFALAAFVIFIGIKIRYGRCYGLIAGYNTASETEKAEYDIEGLADHLGNGVISLGCLTAAAAIVVAVESMTGMLVVFGLFMFMVFIIVVGGQKFLPPDANGQRLSPAQRFFRFLLPARAFAAMETGTRNWMLECKCGQQTDYWESGGIRYKACGERREIAPCQACGQTTWHRVRRKDAE